jgi:hypothetical protein
VSFASDPGRDDGNLPPLNIVIPDDARELSRDVLAYHREMRAQRRRGRLLRLLRPFRGPASSGRAAVIPLIAVCLAISLVGGALLSVATMSPASAPTLTAPQASGQAAVLTVLPEGSVEVNGTVKAVRSLVTSVIALVPANCDCGQKLARLAGQAATAHVPLYFAAAGPEAAQLDALTAHYGGGTAVALKDYKSVLTTAYHPATLTALLVFKNATATVLRSPGPSFELTPAMRALGQDSPPLGASVGAS